MAREVKAYGCDFKCGRKVVMSKKSMTDHESRCFHNPEKKACVTCAHFELEQDDNGMQGSCYHSWNIPTCNATGEHLDKLKNNCELHELKGV
tara:strand:- start:513 stop:788 length:276 start_codon:yes stop_codon:yes gene_type:complete